MSDGPIGGQPIAGRSASPNDAQDAPIDNTPTIVSVSARGTAAGWASANASAVVTRFAFPPEWEQHRQEAIRILRTLPDVLREAEEAFRTLDEVRRLGIGGNHLPESIADVPLAEEIITEAAVAGDALLAELNADSPHLSSIRIAARALRRVAQWTGAILRWMAEKGDRFLDEYLKQLAKPAAYVTAGAIGAKLLGLETSLHSLMGRMSALFAVLHIPL